MVPKQLESNLHVQNDELQWSYTVTLYTNLIENGVYT